MELFRGTFRFKIAYDLVRLFAADMAGRKIPKGYATTAVWVEGDQVASENDLVWSKVYAHCSSLKWGSACIV